MNANDSMFTAKLRYTEYRKTKGVITMALAVIGVIGMIGAIIFSDIELNHLNAQHSHNHH